MSIDIDYENPWIYNGSPFTSADIGDHYGFVYLIENKLNGRKYIGIDINEEYVELSKKRIELGEEYSEENPNPKVKFLLSTEDALAKRKKNDKENSTLL